jgi:chromosome segregation ATPase
MKNYLSTFMTLLCVVLIVSLVIIKRGDSTQHENDIATMGDFSNRLDSAQTQIAIGNGTILTLSNKLDASQSASMDFSNHWMEVKSAFAMASEQVTNLNRHVAEMESENQTLNQRVMELTNQVVGVTKEVALTAASLDQAIKDYALLENRLRIDVAERTVAERKFNNLTELQAQMLKLKNHPAEAISAEGIYAGLDVEVKSNGTLHVISPE